MERNNETRMGATAMRELTEKELEQVSGGALTSENPGGQPHGASQITTTSGNGNAPPGQNKDLPPGLQP
jgi:bacteriocin-like protein